MRIEINKAVFIEIDIIQLEISNKEIQELRKMDKFIMPYEFEVRQFPKKLWKKPYIGAIEIETRECKDAIIKKYWVFKQVKE